MRLDHLLTPEALAFTVAGWSRPAIETAIQQLIDLLDAAGAPHEDREPEPECEVSDGRAGDSDDAEADAPPVQVLRIARRLR